MVNNYRISIIEKNYLNYKKGNAIIIENQILDVLDLSFLKLDMPVYVRRSVIETLKLTTCWFGNGMTLEECVVSSYIDYEMGGHNNKEIVVINNVFTDFFDFFDCHFGAKIIVKNNIFIKGTKLLGNKGKGYENIFDGGADVSCNLGRLDENN